MSEEIAEGATDIKYAADILLRLKMSTSPSHCSNISADNLTTFNHNDSFVLGSSSQSIVTMQYCAWKQLFDKMKFQLRNIRDVIMNTVASNSDHDDFPNIEETFQHMLHLSSNGYLIIQLTTTSVIHRLQHVMLSSFHRVVSSRQVSNATFLSLFSKILSSLNKYESCASQQLTKNSCNLSTQNQIQTFIALVLDLKSKINSLLPQQRDSIIEIIGNNIMCIEKTGLLAEDALFHVVHHIENMQVNTE